MVIYDISNNNNNSIWDEKEIMPLEKYNKKYFFKNFLFHTMQIIELLYILGLVIVIFE